MNDLVVVDLSHHNPTPDWTALKAGGVVGVIHKATEGTSYVDDQLFARARPAIDAGLKWATYHFLRPGGTYAQMDHYLSTVDPVDGERMVLDHEDAGVSLSQLAEAVSNLLEMRPDLKISIYSGHLIKEQLGGNYHEYLAANTSLWIAQYTSAAAPSWPSATWPQWSLWQYTDKATVAGVSKPVDGNRFNGSVTQCMDWFGPAGAPVPKPAPKPDKSVLVAITQPSGVVVTVTLNGEIVVG
jgi:lysozyme